jgi:hypothetical protein
MLIKRRRARLLEIAQGNDADAELRVAVFRRILSSALDHLFEMQSDQGPTIGETAMNSVYPHSTTDIARKRHELTPDQPQGADVRHPLRDWNSVPVLVEGKDGGFATSGEFLCHV